MQAKLRFSYGTMSSGKSLRVLTTAYDFEQRGIPFVILKSDVDTRDGIDTIKSRIGDGISRPCVPVAPADDVYRKVCEIMDVQGLDLRWVIVDEVQFFTEAQIDGLARVVDELGIDVYCFGLRTDFRTRLFPGSRRLFEIADKIEELKSTCDCGRKSCVNARVDGDGNIVLDGEQTEVGGDDRYVTMCRKCYFDKVRGVSSEDADMACDCNPDDDTVSVSATSYMNGIGRAVTHELIAVLESARTNDTASAERRLKPIVACIVDCYGGMASNAEKTEVVEIATNDMMAFLMGISDRPSSTLTSEAVFPYIVETVKDLIDNKNHVSRE